MTQATSIVHPSRACLPSAQNSKGAARVVSAIILASSLSFMAMGVWLVPDPSGVGTHRQFGLPPCGFLAATGLPCATCGMTTAVSHAANGQLIRSFLANPAGAILAVMVASLAVLSATSLWVGFPISPALKPLWNRYTLLGVMVVAMLSWGYKILVVRGVL